MKYERKSPFSDGFNDIYAGFGVDADDYWARKRMLLGSGGGGGAGEGDTANAGMLGGFGPDDPDGPPGGTGSHSSEQAQANEDAANAQAEAEAQGEMDAYAAVTAPSFGRSLFNAISPIDIGRTHDEFGRGVPSLDFSVPSIAAAMVGLGPIGALAAVAVEGLAKGVGVDTTVSVGPEGISTSSPGMGPIGEAVASSIGVDTSPGSLSSLSGPSTGGPSSTAGLGGFGGQEGGDPALLKWSPDGTNPYGILSLGQTIQEQKNQDLDVGGGARAVSETFPIVPINTTDVGTSGFNLAPTTRPFVNPPVRQPVPLQTPFFQQPNFQPFARPMRNGGAVHHGIGSMLQIR